MNPNFKVVSLAVMVLFMGSTLIHTHVAASSDDYTHPVEIRLSTPKGDEIALGDQITFEWSIQLDVDQLQGINSSIIIATDPFFSEQGVVFKKNITDSTKRSYVETIVDGSDFSPTYREYFWRVNWTYALNTTPPMKIVSTSDIEHFYYGDAPPTLTVPEDTPESGDTDTEFEFTVTYEDREKLVPDFLNLYIGELGKIQDAEPLQADLNDVEYDTKGIPYKFSHEFEDAGTYEYYFEVSDPAGNIVESEVMTVEVKKGDDSSTSIFGDTTTVLCMITFVTILVMFITAMIIFRRRTEEDDGSDLDWEKQAKKKEKEFTCSECGAKVPANSETCPQCGEEFEGEEFVCPNCQAEVSEDSTKCPKCGTTFQDLGGKPSRPSLKGGKTSAPGKGGGPSAPGGKKGQTGRGGVHEKGVSSGSVSKDQIEGTDFICSICGAKVKGKSKRCPKCGMEFD